jgi:apolipoprotein N-acyltransferase
MTAIIRPDGEVDTEAAPYTRQVLVGYAQGRTGSTPYMKHGNWPILAFCLFLLVAPLVKWKKRVKALRDRYHYRDHI